MSKNTKVEIENYWKKRLINPNVEVEYNSETDEINIAINRKTKDDAYSGWSYLTIYPSHVGPLCELLKEVTTHESN